MNIRVTSDWLCVVVAVILAFSEARAATIGPAASLNSPRQTHTATLLSDGQVLVAGGRNDLFRLSSAELYDPTNNIWNPAANLSTARHVHTATLLANGKVLAVAGLDDNFTALASAEIYDPSANTWSAAGNLSTARAYHTATLMPGGKVLVAGGVDVNFNVLSSAEIYDPVSNTWTSAGSLSTARSYHTATLLPSGKVLVAGGFDTNFSALVGAEIYDPVSNQWSAAHDLSGAHAFHTATLLTNGQVIVVGGTDGTANVGSAEIYDPARDSWRKTGSLVTARQYHTASLLPSGNVLVIGGDDNTGTPLASTEVYDIATSAWTAAGNLGTARRYHTATLLASGKVLISAGESGSRQNFNVDELNSAEVYDSSNIAWATAAALNASREHHSATLLPNGKVLVSGGIGANNPFNAALTSAEVYDPSGNTWSSTANNMGTAREFQTATLLANGKVLVVGGFDNNVTITNSAELYDPASNTWSPAGSLVTARYQHTATLLSDGRVLVAGGFNGSYLNSAEIYDPAQNTWSAAGNLKSVRANHTATLLPDGQVLVAGGLTTVSLSSAELYDPASNSWIAASALATARSQHSATLLPSGKVLIAGGNNKQSGYLNSAEIYDPPTDTWIATASPLGTARGSHTATLLPSGKVIVAGGNSAAGALSSSEVYDSISDAWIPIKGLGASREYHTATLLLSGQVLVVGGYDGATTLSTAQLADDGLMYQAAWRPVIKSVNAVVGEGMGGNAVILSGSQFKGLSEASSGGTNNSASNYPLLLLRSLGNDQVLTLPVDPANPASNTGFTSLNVSADFPQGYASATIFTNGIPSTSAVIQLIQLRFTPTTLPPAKMSVPYSQLITASHGTTPYVFSILAGALPSGLTLNSTGSLSGTPRVTGTFRFTVGVTDGTPGVPASASKVYALTVDQLIATQTIAASNSATRSTTEQSVILSASVVASSGNAVINEGTVTFHVFDSNNVEVSAPATSSTVVNGATNASYLLPANLNVGQYTIVANYNGTFNFAASSDTSKTLFVITPGGGTAPAVTIVSIDRNPARVGTPVTIVAQGNSFSGLPLTYTWYLFNHGEQLPRPDGNPLQTGPSNVLVKTFTVEGDFDIGVGANDSYAGAGTVQRIEILPLEPNSGSVAKNIKNQMMAVNPNNALGISVSSSVGGALNVDSVPNTKTSSVTPLANDAETYTYKVNGQIVDPNTLHAVNSAAKFPASGIHVIQLDAIQGTTMRHARIMVPVGKDETGLPLAAPDKRSNTSTSKFAIYGRLSKTALSTVLLTSTIEISPGLLLTDMQEIEFGVSNFHTKITVNTKGKVISGPDDAHFQKIRISMPKIDRVTHRTPSGASMIIYFNLVGTGQDLADNGFGTDGVEPLAMGTQAGTLARTLQYAAIVAGMTYQSNLTVRYTPTSDFGNVAGRSGK